MIDNAMSFSYRIQFHYSANAIEILLYNAYLNHDWTFLTAKEFLI